MLIINNRINPVELYYLQWHSCTYIWSIGNAGCVTVQHKIGYCTKLTGLCITVVLFSSFPSFITVQSTGFVRILYTRVPCLSTHNTYSRKHRVNKVRIIDDVLFFNQPDSFIFIFLWISFLFYILATYPKRSFNRSYK